MDTYEIVLLLFAVILKFSLIIAIIYFLVKEARRER